MLIGTVTEITVSARVAALEANIKASSQQAADAQKSEASLRSRLRKAESAAQDIQA